MSISSSARILRASAGLDLKAFRTRRSIFAPYRRSTETVSRRLPIPLERATASREETNASMPGSARTPHASDGARTQRVPPSVKRPYAHRSHLAGRHGERVVQHDADHDEGAVAIYPRPITPRSPAATAADSSSRSIPWFVASFDRHFASQKTTARSPSRTTSSSGPPEDVGRSGCGIRRQRSSWHRSLAACSPSPPFRAASSETSPETTASLRGMGRSSSR